jgi:hypothetical protein
MPIPAVEPLGDFHFLGGSRIVGRQAKAAAVVMPLPAASFGRRVAVRQKLA